MELWKKVANLLLNGQAYLYADLNRITFEGKGVEVTEQMFKDWQEEWMKEAEKELGRDI